MPAANGTIRDKRSTAELFAENTYQVTDGFALVAGAQIFRAMRGTDNDTAFFISDYPDGTVSRTYTYLNPKIGAIWTPAGGTTQFYGNLSRNHEAPSSVVFYTQRGSLPNSPKSTLNAQRADTV
ncbi:TonB-dependent receptor [uncultured Oxalicibacterium sp.]|uniref:TonB-dependent receptor domain-containing protein n=1 Tax=uncultured Oxalicibacterium sp. TaxID=1168540 RepID=UPI0025F696EB|nr:TonB-dependent receptor [uncultured Oxalicibacterium sp.]